MEIKKAKSILDDILDICSQLGSETLDEACTGIYNDVHAAKTADAVVSSARELMVFVNEAPWEDYDMSELKNEIEELFLKLLEEYEEF
jgi:hypothetical protein